MPGGYGSRYQGGGTPPPASSGGGGFGSKFNAPASKPAKAKPKGRHGFGGFVGNLGSDLEGTLLGIGPGVVNTAKAVGSDVYHHPQGLLIAGPAAAIPSVRRNARALTHGQTVNKVAKPVVQSYVHTYGPLAHGDVSAFVHNLYEHPLGPILDAATVASLGAGAVAKVGRVAAEAGKVSETSRLATLGKAGRMELRSPRAIEQAKDGEPITGPTIEKRTSRAPLRKAQQLAFDRILKLTPEHAPFVGEIARYGREADRLPKQAKMARALKVRDYNRAVGKLTPEEFAALHIIGRGVHPDDLAALWAGNEPMLKVLANPKIRKLVDEPNQKVLAAAEEARKLGKVDADLKVKYGIVTQDTVDQHLGAHRYAAQSFLPAGHDLKPMPHDPFYVPDKMVAPKGGEFSKRGGGRGVPKLPSGGRENRMILFRTGQLALRPDLLGPEYLGTVKYAHFDDIHNALIASAVRVPKGHPLPKGYVYIRRRVGRSSGETISHTQQNLAEFERGIQDLVVKGNHAGAVRDAEQVHGHYLAVPDRMAKQMAGEFTQSSSAAKAILERPTQVWRALVLGYRPAFLVNNVVGNHLMLALHYAGPAGLRAYLNALKTAKGPEVVRGLLRDPATPKAISKQFMDEFFPDQVEGTFGATQGVVGKIKRPVVRKAAKAALAGVIPATQAASEGFLRRVGVEASLRTTPEVKAILRQMPKDTRRIEAASRQALEADPGLAREISDRVNSALGDYLNLSPAERGAVRAVFPFYAWYRAIVAVTAKLPLEVPGRTLILSRLAQTQGDIADKQLGDVPSYLRGSAPLGKPHDGLQTILGTQGINPFATPVQVGQAVRALLPGGNTKDISALAGQMNPFVIELAKIIAAASNHDAPGKGHKLGVLGETLYNVEKQLPQQQLNRGPSNLYPQRDLLSQLLAYVGAPKKELNLDEARYQHDQGR